MPSQHIENYRRFKNNCLSELITDYPNISLKMFYIFDSVPKDYNTFLNEKEISEYKYSTGLRNLFDELYDMTYPETKKKEFDFEKKNSFSEDENDTDIAEDFEYDESESEDEWY